MLIITVELHSAITGKVTEIAKMKLYNDGTGTSQKGNYAGVTYRGKDDALIQEKTNRTGSVKNYPRLNLHVWNLIARMLKNMGYK
jgi:hypothetical protein